MIPMDNVISAFFANNWYWLLVFAGMSVLVFLLLRLQVLLREHMAKNIQILLVRDPGLCLERLENNRRLKWLFRKPILLLWKLDCYLALGEDRKALQTIDLLRNAGADKEKHYAAILDEAEIIIGVYVDHNVSLIKKLTGRAEHTKNDVMRGVIQYRIAKLAWFKGDEELMRTYLTRAGKNLKGTLYAPIIEAAREDPSILETK